MALVALVLSLVNTSFWCLTIGTVLRKRSKLQKIMKGKQ